MKTANNFILEVAAPGKNKMGFLLNWTMMFLVFLLKKKRNIKLAMKAEGLPENNLVRTTFKGSLVYLNRYTGKRFQHPTIMEFLKLFCLNKKKPKITLKNLFRFYRCIHGFVEKVSILILFLFKKHNPSRPNTLNHKPVPG